MISSNTADSDTDETFEALHADALKYRKDDDVHVTDGEYGMKMVMISLHVATMEPSAKWLKSELEKRGVSVWMCTTALQAGDNYRNEIVEAVKSSRVVLPMINKNWSKSGECEAEFQLAIRTNLISHDTGATAHTITVDGADGKPYPISGIRRPAFLPLKFPDIEWRENPGVEQLSCLTNFVVCNDVTLLEDASGATKADILQQIIHGLRNLGIKVNRLHGDAAFIHMAKRTVSNVRNPVELAKQVIAGIQVQLQNTQDLFTLVSSKASSSFAGANLRPFALTDLKKRYLGYCTNLRNGCEVLWSLEFHIDPATLPADDDRLIIPITGSMTASIMKVTDEAHTQESKASLAIFSNHKAKSHSAIAQLKGRFNRERGLAILDAFQKQDEYGIIRICKYRIILEQDPNNSAENGKYATGLFHPIPDDKDHYIHDDDEWTAVIRLIATA
ncbi:hypothetical protein HK100_007417 [Physocladia obscura]|uniref:TIR domain-containing protein n=1 Tax=Physocladia obscura TaxID=109957 RepID=A0AAD5T9J0_9FUNG|nr:hypothetical protein HK100_007417 [Physocladia obscura]